MHLPLLGPNGTYGNYHPQVTSQLITNGIFDEAIHLGFGRSGSTVGQWCRRGPLHHHFAVALLRAEGLGYKNHPDITTIGNFNLGPSDAQIGTGFDDYRRDALDIFEFARERGWNINWFVTRCTRNAGVNSSTIYDAQTSLEDTANGVFLGADADTIIGTLYERADLTHKTDAGYSLLAVDAADKIESVFS
jgi:hypothetical protein